MHFIHGSGSPLKRSILHFIPPSLNLFPRLPLLLPPCQLFPLLSSVSYIHLGRSSNLVSDRCPVKLMYKLCEQIAAEWTVDYGDTLYRIILLLPPEVQDPGYNK